MATHVIKRRSCKDSINEDQQFNELRSSCSIWSNFKKNPSTNAACYPSCNTNILKEFCFRTATCGWGHPCRPLHVHQLVCSAADWDHMLQDQVLSKSPPRGLLLLPMTVPAMEAECIILLSWFGWNDLLWSGLCSLHTNFEDKQGALKCSKTFLDEQEA